MNRDVAGRGTTASHTVTTLDGIEINYSNQYWSDLVNEQVTVQTSPGGTAESIGGGVRINLTLRDGGNNFSGQAFAAGSSGAWQSDNFTQRLKDLQVQSVDKIGKIFDYSVTEGGPILRNRLWFNYTSRYWGNGEQIADVFKDDGSQYEASGWLFSTIPRLTWQATPKNKFVAHFDRMAVFRGPKLQATYPPRIDNVRGVDPETATTYRSIGRPFYNWLLSWKSTASSRLLLEVAAGKKYQANDFNPQPGVKAARGTPDWYAHTVKVDTDLDKTWNGVSLWQLSVVGQPISAAAAATYVTGSHALKAGVQYRWGETGTFQTWDGDIQQVTYRQGVPTSVTINNSPLVTMSGVEYDFGIFAQDQWTFKRLTLTGGLRFEGLSEYIPEQNAGAGRFVPERHFARTPVIALHNVLPRFGFAYDLFGNAKTALKGSVGLYNTPASTGLVGTLNPLALATVTLPWSDPNGDGVVQDSELDIAGRVPRDFGNRLLNKLDPDFKREANVESDIALQHELFPNVSVGFGWYRRAFLNLRVTDNVLISPSDYVPVQFVNPYNGEIVTSYNLRDASLLAASVPTNISVTNSDTNSRVYNGYEFTFEARLPNGGLVFGSSSTQRTLTNNCDQRDDPNNLRFCDRGNIPSPYVGVPFLTDFRVGASYPLPARMHVSLSWTSLKDKGFFVNNGENFAVNYLITQGTRYRPEDCLNRPCTPGALVIPGLVQSSITVPLIPAGTERLMPRVNQVDIGVRTSFRFAGAEWVPRLDLFNALNLDTELQIRSFLYATPAFGLPGGTTGASVAAGFNNGPSGTMPGRIPRLGLQIKW